jgi:hypothetical protein
VPIIDPYISLDVYGRQLNTARLPLETHARIDTLTVGVILSYLYHFRRTSLLETARRHRTVLTMSSVVLLLPAFFWPLDHSAVMPSVGLLSIAVGFAGFFSSASPRRDGPKAGTRLSDARRRRWRRSDSTRIRSTFGTCQSRSY